MAERLTRLPTSKNPLEIYRRSFPLLNSEEKKLPANRPVLYPPMPPSNQPPSPSLFRPPSTHVCNHPPDQPPIHTHTHAQAGQRLSRKQNQPSTPRLPPGAFFAAWNTRLGGVEARNIYIYTHIYAGHGTEKWPRICFARGESEG